MKKKFLIMLAMVAILAVSLIVIVGCEEEFHKESAPIPAINQIEFGADWLRVLNVSRKEGVEFSLDNVLWQDSCEFKNLTPNTEYTLYVRMKETEIYLVGEVVTKKFTTLKYVQTKVPNATLERVQYTVELTQTENEEYEYSYDKGATYISENKYTYVAKNEKYSILVRYKETDTHYAGEAQKVDVSLNIYETGTGTQEDPYIISNYEQFIKIGEKGYYKLIKDIYYPKEFVDVSVYAAKSYIDGNYKKIIAPKLKNSFSKIHFGVFSDVLSVKNLTIEDAQLNKLGSGNSIGILASNGTYVENCHVSGEITSNGASTIGGLVAILYDLISLDGIEPIIVNSSANTVVKYDGFHGLTFGGLCGIANDEAIISSSSATFDVKSKYQCYESEIGGIIGSAEQCEITNCYAVGSVYVVSSDNDTSIFVGGIVGRSNAKVVNCYADIDVAIDVTQLHPESKGTISIGGIIGGNQSYTEVQEMREIKNSFSNSKITISDAPEKVNIIIDTITPKPKEADKVVIFSDNYSSGTFLPYTTNHFSMAVDNVKALDAEILQWDESIWLFEEGKLPQLKHMM